MSASIAGTIVDATGGVVVDRATGLSFPNGLALGADGFLYVAETGLSRVSRLPIAADGTLGAREVYATGLPAADGISLDRNLLLVVGAGTLWVVNRTTRAVWALSNDPLLDWPSNIAFGRGRGFRKKDLFLANFGPSLGDGTTVVRMPYNRRGARLVRETRRVAPSSAWRAGMTQGARWPRRSPSRTSTTSSCAVSTSRACSASTSRCSVWWRSAASMRSG